MPFESPPAPSSATDAGVAETTGTVVRLPGYPRTYRRLVQGTNINPQTLLATDYLNHFNEIAMLLDLIPEMPDCIEDALEWRPIGYQEHFRNSVLADRHLTIAAYDNVPAMYRAPFDRTVRQLHDLVDTGLERIVAAIARDDPALLQVTVESVSQSLQRLMDAANGIIHGTVETVDQSAIDLILETASVLPSAADPEPEPHPDPDPEVPADLPAVGAEPMGQDDIDALFA